MRGLLAGLLAWGTMGPVGAEELAWASFLRARPNPAAPVLREMARGEAFERVACDGGWCQVRVAGRLGFLPDSAIAAPPALRPDAGRAARPTDCIGYRRGDGRPEMLCRGAE